MTSQPQDWLLYHYTSMNALFEILKDVTPAKNGNPPVNTIKMRATHAHFMNDPVEYRYLTDILIKVIKEGDLFAQSDETQLGDKIKQDILIMDMMDGVPPVFSLSKHRDELPMWETYGLSGKGVAIGFSYKSLKSLEASGWKLEECNYID